MKNHPEDSHNLKEQTVHGNHEFPLEIYANMEYHKKDIILYNHWHEEVEILFVTGGSMELVVDNISISAPKNTVVLIPPNLLHAAYPWGKEKGTFTSIVFHPDFISSKNEDIIQTRQLNPFLENSFVSSYVIYHTDRKNEMVMGLLREVIQAYERPQPFRELLIKGLLCQALYHLLLKEEKHSLKSVSDYINEERKKKILGFLEDNYQNPLTLDDMASSVSLSREQFCRFFKKSFRSTPVQYLNNYRINRAVTLLQETGMSVTDIAVRTGFDNSNYFAVSFKKATGMTPTQFRNMT